MFPLGHFNCPDEIHSFRAGEVRETSVEKKGRTASQCSHTQKNLSALFTLIHVRLTLWGNVKLTEG